MWLIGNMKIDSYTVSMVIKIMLIIAVDYPYS